MIRTIQRRFLYSPPIPVDIVISYDTSTSISSESQLTIEVSIDSEVKVYINVSNDIDSISSIGNLIAELNDSVSLISLDSIKLYDTNTRSSTLIEDINDAKNTILSLLSSSADSRSYIANNRITSQDSRSLISSATVYTGDARSTIRNGIMSLIDSSVNAEVILTYLINCDTSISVANTIAKLVDTKENNSTDKTFTFDSRVLGSESKTYLIDLLTRVNKNLSETSDTKISVINNITVLHASSSAIASIIGRTTDAKQNVSNLYNQDLVYTSAIVKKSILELVDTAGLIYSEGDFGPQPPFIQNGGLNPEYNQEEHIQSIRKVLLLGSETSAPIVVLPEEKIIYIADETSPIIIVPTKAKYPKE